MAAINETHWTECNPQRQLSKYIYHWKRKTQKNVYTYIIINDIKKSKNNCSNKKKIEVIYSNAVISDVEEYTHQCRERLITADKNRNKCKRNI